MYYQLSVSGLTEIKSAVPSSQFGGSSKFIYNQDGLVEKAPTRGKIDEETKENRLNREKQIRLNLIPKEVKTKSFRSYTLPKSKIRKKCSAFFNLKASKAFCAFYSISFPERLPDNMCYQLFNTFLTRCRKNYNLKSYIWVAERQKNGTLHYHMLTNKYMPIQPVNGFMASALRTQANRGNLPKNVKVPEKYNGVDVDNLYYSKRRKHKQKRLSHTDAQRRLGYYITKYISKNDEVFERLCWHCSRDISALFTSVRFEDIDSTEIPELIHQNHDKVKVFEHEYFTHTLLLFDLPQYMFEPIHQINNEIYSRINSS